MHKIDCVYEIEILSFLTREMPNRMDTCICDIGREMYHLSLRAKPSKAEQITIIHYSSFSDTLCILGFNRFLAFQSLLYRLGKVSMQTNNYKCLKY